MVKIGVTGASGRMGNAIISAIEATDGAELYAALEMAGHPTVGKYAGGDSDQIRITDDLDNFVKVADVLIDFSAPEATLKLLEKAAIHKKSVVIGTTGFSASQRDTIKDYGKDISIVMAPNMSIGINLLLKLIEVAAPRLKDDYDIEIIEAHHKHKKDAPSGTALRIAEVAAESVDRDLNKVGVYERHGIIGERKKNEIGIQTIRGGDIVGDHTIMFAGPGERLELTHRAHSRDTFANGAVRASLWIADKEDGLYDMQDVLELNAP